MAVRMVVRNGEVSWVDDTPRRRSPRPPATRPRADQGTHRLSWYQAMRAPLITKEEALCCMSQVDDLGRPPIGHCGPDCLRKVERDGRLARS